MIKHLKNIWLKFPKNKSDRIVIEIPPSNIPKDNKKDSDGWLMYRADKFFFKRKTNIKIEKILFLTYLPRKFTISANMNISM